MKAIIKKSKRRLRRRAHVRKQVSGTDARPRLSVFRSHKHIYAQIINDSDGKTLASSSTQDKALRQQLGQASGNKAAAEAVGKDLAAKAASAGIKKVVFDRNGYPFHGRVRSLAEAARKGGLDF